MAKLLTWAKVSLRFEALHQWDAAPNDVEFLQDSHRHEFHVTVHIQQFHDDRDVEYIMLKRWLKNWLDLNYEKQDLGQMSCEMMCKEILDELEQKHGSKRQYKVEVTEDGENGAVVEKSA